MKLLTRTTYYYFLFSLVAMVAAGFVFYHSIRNLVYRQINDSLITEKTIIQDQLEETDTIPDFSASFGHLIEVKLLDKPGPEYIKISDTTLFDSKTGINTPFRHLKVTGSTIRQTGYSINIYQVLDENQELLDKIGLGMFLLFLTLLSLSILVNYLISRSIFRPFLKAINEAAAFNVVSGKPVKLESSTIEEFTRLNRVIEQMTTKMRSDYVSLKEYHEDFSHEIQTPLAIIRSKIDLMLQNENLDIDTINTIRSINDAATRLSKLNQGLLFISRIENLQFEDLSDISIKQIIENCLSNYDEILKLRRINIELELHDPGIIRMNSTLAEVLVSNLLSNAVRYNNDGGFIKCCLDDKNLRIMNSGNPPDVDPGQLFKRFRRNSSNTQSVGLGLSIVKKITDHFGMSVTYKYSEGIHELNLRYLP